MIARRRFGKVMIMTAAARALGFRPSIATADPALETTRLRISKVPSVCVSPQYVAQELFGGEGFTDVQYIASPGGLPGANALGAGKEDIQMNFAAPLVLALDS